MKMVLALSVALLIAAPTLVFAQTNTGTRPYTTPSGVAAPGQNRMTPGPNTTPSGVAAPGLQDPNRGATGTAGNSGAQPPGQNKTNSSSGKK